MLKNFEALAQANVDHYNSHPTAHNAITGAMAVGACVAIIALARKLSKEDRMLRAGQYAK